MSCSSLSSQAALPIIINTRPVERAAPLTQHLQALGYSVAAIPMLALEPQPVSATDIKLMHQWLAGGYQALVVVSPTAAASGLAVWQKLERQTQIDSNSKLLTTVIKMPSALIAVGEATAAVLQEANYQVLQPTIANNEGMLAMAEIKSLQAGDKLLVWRGLGGRRLLVDTLQARGVHIDSIAWYERTLPEQAYANYKRWLKQFSQLSTTINRPKPVVIISSGTAFEHWIKVVSQAQSSFSELHNNITLLSLADFAYVVLGVRLAEMVAEQQLDYWRVEDLDPKTIAAVISSTQPVKPPYQSSTTSQLIMNKDE